MSEYDESGRLVLCEDDEHDVAVSLAPEGDESLIVTLPAAPDHVMVEMEAGPLDRPTYPTPLATAGRSTVRDRFGYGNRTAESFVAHWLLWHHGWDLCLHGGSGAWGSAASWHLAAERMGAVVDARPEVGAVAQSHLGFGHVAVVVGVVGDTVTVCDFDHAMSGDFGRRTVPSATYRYLHLHRLRAALPRSAG